MLKLFAFLVKKNFQDFRQLVSKNGGWFSTLNHIHNENREREREREKEREKK